MHPALQQLQKIIEMESTPTKLGFRRRQEALDRWIKRWFEKYYEYQDVVDVKQLSSGYKDALTMKVAQDLLLTILEDCITIDIHRQKIVAELQVLRKKPK